MIVQTTLGDLHRRLPVLLAVERVIGPERRSEESHPVQDQRLVLQQMDGTALPCLLPPFGICLFQRCTVEAIELVITCDEHRPTLAHVPQHFDPVGDAAPDIVVVSRFDAAPFIAFIATKEMNYGPETDGRVSC